ncbi:hypothetical protein ACMFMF_000888 [Clarireedia jacksonii]
MWSGLRATAKTSPVYAYYWDHAPPGQTQGAYHEPEINYVLNSLYGTDLPWTAEDYVIAKKMNSYWVNFIRTGNPNGSGLTQWDPSANSSAVVQHLGDGWGPLPIVNNEVQVQLYKDCVWKRTSQDDVKGNPMVWIHSDSHKCILSVHGKFSLIHPTIPKIIL